MLINALDKLGDTIIDATKAQGTHYTPDYQPPDGSDPTVTGVFPTSHMNAQAQVAQMSDAEVLNRSRQEKIAGFRQEMKDASRPGAPTGFSTTAEIKKGIRKRYAEFQKEQKSLRFNFRRGKGDFSRQNREQTMAEYRDRLAADINEGTVATNRKFQTEGSIRPVSGRTPTGGGGALYSVSDDLDVVDSKYKKPAPGRATRSGVTSTTGMTGAGEAGGLAIDPTALQGVLTGFNDMFATTLQEVINPFKEMAAHLGSLSQSFENLTMTHKFTGDLSMAFNITNQAELVDVISKGITPKIASMIVAAVNGQKNAGKTDTTGGASGLPPSL